MRTVSFEALQRDKRRARIRDERRLARGEVTPELPRILWPLACLVLGSCQDAPPELGDGRVLQPLTTRHSAEQVEVGKVAQGNPAKLPPLKNEIEVAEDPIDKPPPEMRRMKIEEEITFGALADQLGVTVEKLNELNGLKLDAATRLAVGSELYVPIPPPII